MPTKTSEVYKKTEYLTANQYAKTHNESPKIVEKALQKARLLHASIKINTMLREIIISNHGRLHVRPEPEAHKKLQEIIEQLKGQQK